jgi:hypothetical protein
MSVGNNPGNTRFFLFIFFSRGESPLHIRGYAETNLGGPNAVYQEEALARRQGIWCSERHKRSQEPVGNRHWGQRKVSVNATGRGPKLTARRLGGDKQSTQPGGVHPGLDTGREARHLRNNCSGRHERNTMSVEINNPYEHMKLSVNARGRGPNLTARRLGGDKQSTQPGDVHPRLDTGHAAGCLRNNCHFACLGLP